MKKLGLILVIFITFLLAGCNWNTDKILSNYGEVSIDVDSAARIIAPEWDLSSVSSWNISFSNSEYTKKVENASLPSSATLPVGEYKVVVEGTIKDNSQAKLYGETSVVVKASEKASAAVAVALKKQGTCPSFTYKLIFTYLPENIGDLKATLTPLFGGDVVNMETVPNFDDKIRSTCSFTASDIPSGYYKLNIYNEIFYNELEISEINIPDAVIELADGISLSYEQNFEEKDSSDKEGADISFYATTNPDDKYSGCSKDYPMYINDLLKNIGDNYENKNIDIYVDVSDSLCLDAAYLATGNDILINDSEGSSFFITKSGNISLYSMPSSPSMIFTTSNPVIKDVSIDLTANMDVFRLKTINGVNLILNQSLRNQPVYWDDCIPSTGANFTSLYDSFTNVIISNTNGYKAYCCDYYTIYETYLLASGTYGNIDKKMEEYNYSCEPFSSVAFDKEYCYTVSDFDGDKNLTIYKVQENELKTIKAYTLAENRNIKKLLVDKKYLYAIESNDFTVEVTPYDISILLSNQSKELPTVNPVKYSIPSELIYEDDDGKNLEIADALYHDGNIYLLLNNTFCDYPNPSSLVIYRFQGGVLKLDINKVQNSKLLGWEKNSSPSTFTGEAGDNYKERKTYEIKYEGPGKNSQNIFSPTHFYAIKPNKLEFADYGYYLCQGDDEYNGADQPYKKIAKYDVKSKYVLDLEKMSLSKISNEITFNDPSSSVTSSYWATKKPSND